MKNNQIGDISVNTSKRPRARFNLPYDVNTTSSWGDLQPHVCKFMMPNSKNVVQVESLTRLASLLRPTFGRILFKEYHQFVELDDVWKPFSAFMSKTHFHDGSNLYVPTCVPRIPLCMLSLFVLTGAKVTLYSVTNGESAQNFGSTTRLYNATTSNLGTAASAIVGAFKNLTSYTDSFFARTDVTNPSYLPFDYDGPALDAFKLLSFATRSWLSNQLPSGTSLPSLMLPIGNQDDKSWFRPQGLASSSTKGFDPDYVPLETADLVVPWYVKYNNVDYYGYSACRLSSFGKRLRKVLLGCGYQINLQSREVVSLLPLMSFFKAYYDIFGITQSSNYTSTLLSRYSDYVAYHNENDWLKVWYTSDSSLRVSCGLLKGFLLSLADCWYTENNDFVSVHQDRTLVDYAADFDPTKKYISFTDPKDTFTSPSISSQYQGDGFKAVNSSGVANPFTALDIDMLKRLYRWSNVNSVAGKAIADALKAQGFKAFDTLKSNFIGSHEEYIPISDVVSTSDTLTKDSSGAYKGSMLGDYGGKGIGYSNGNAFVYETDKFGYWIGFFGIIPKSGYSQGLDMTLVDTENEEFYQPMFDNLGYQADTTACVAEAIDFGVHYGENANLRTFGVAPRYIEWKVAKNISNGDFSLRGVRSSYQPFCLDKEIPINERAFVVDSDSGSGQDGYLQETNKKILPINNLPTAGVVWRYINKYPWIGTFDRIFANFDSDDIYARLMVLTRGWDNLYPIVNSYDNFLVHCIVNQTYYAPMMPVEQTFGTDDDGKFDGSQEKA